MTTYALVITCGQAYQPIVYLFDERGSPVNYLFEDSPDWNNIPMREKLWGDVVLVRRIEVSDDEHTRFSDLVCECAQTGILGVMDKVGQGLLSNLQKMPVEDDCA